MQRGIVDAKLKVIPKAGHLSNMENSTAFNEALLSFLAAGF